MGKDKADEYWCFDHLQEFLRAGKLLRCVSHNEWDRAGNSRERVSGFLQGTDLPFGGIQLLFLCDECTAAHGNLL